jgi:azurin
MKFLYFLSLGILLNISSNTKADDAAGATCAIIEATREFESSKRIEKVNNYRLDKGLPPYKAGDDFLKTYIRYGLCEELVSMDPQADDMLKAALALEEERRQEQRLRREEIARQERLKQEALAAERAKAIAQSLKNLEMEPECIFPITVGDSLKFSVSQINVPKSCSGFAIELTHEGKLPAKIMGHNWVLTNTADVQAVAMEGMRAGLVAKYVPPDDPRVLAVSNVIGGGERTILTSSMVGLDSDSDYTFFCSFPGHSYSMRGKFIVN